MPLVTFPSWLCYTNAFEVSPQLQPCCAIQSQQPKLPPLSPPLRDLPLRPHLVCLLVGSHLPVKKTGYEPSASLQSAFVTHKIDFTKWSV